MKKYFGIEIDGQVELEMVRPLVSQRRATFLSPIPILKVVMSSPSRFLKQLHRIRDLMAGLVGLLTSLASNSAKLFGLILWKFLRLLHYRCMKLPKIRGFLTIGVTHHIKLNERVPRLIYTLLLAVPIVVRQLWQHLGFVIITKMAPGLIGSVISISNFN